MNREPETYDELIRYKRCVDLTSHYELSKDELERIYNYLEQNPQALIVGNENSLTLTIEKEQAPSPEIINARCIDASIDGVELSNDIFITIPHYDPSSSGGYSGGSSSNNNNNNNR